MSAGVLSIVATGVLTLLSFGRVILLEQHGSLTAAVSTPSSGPRSETSVQAALRSHIRQEDQTTLHDTVISGDYALQSWRDSDFGGEALLKYDSVSEQWNLVTWGGGAWSVDGLVQFEGVPQDVATTLVAGMPH